MYISDFNTFFEVFKVKNRSNKKLNSLAGDDNTRISFIEEWRPYFEEFWNAAKKSSDDEIIKLNENIDDLIIENNNIKSDNEYLNSECESLKGDIENANKKIQKLKEMMNT